MSSKGIIPQEDWNELQYACSLENIELVKQIIHTSGIDANWTTESRVIPQVTPLHIACKTGNLELIKLLLPLSNINKADQAGNTAKDLADSLGFTDIIDALTSRLNLEKDPTVPKFRAWLTSLGAGEFLMNFIHAGYDLPFIAKEGLTGEDLDSVIPPNKGGIRRKIMKLHDLDKFYTPKKKEKEEEEEEEEEEEGEDEEDEEEGDEEGEDEEDE